MNKEIENNKELKDNISKLESELEEKEDQIFFMGNKVKKLEKSIKNYRKPLFFSILSASWLNMAPRWLQDGPT